MARKYKCPRPVNRLLHMRTGGLSGPFVQNIGGGRCVHTAGNAHGIGGPLSGPKPVNGYVVDATTIKLTFSQCVQHKNPPCVAPYGLTLTNDGNALTVTSVSIADRVMTLLVSGTIQAGDKITLSYDDSGACFEDCKEGEPIGPFTSFPVHNPLVLEGNFIQLETGGTDIILLEDDTDGTNGLQLEDAP